MTIRTIAAVACATAGLLAAMPASAACSLKTQPIPIKLDVGRPTVDVKVNGRTGHFLLDSGTAVNQISTKFAGALKLTSTKGPSGVDVVTAPKFEFAGASLANVPFVQSDKLGDVDGVIGQTILRLGDVDYDLNPFSGAKVQLAKAEGCEGANLAYWVKEGQTYSEMPLEPLDKTAPFTKSEVVINGVKMKALFASGAPYSIITEKAAAKAGVKTTDPKIELLGGGDGKSAKLWLGTFSTVSIGGEDLKNVALEISPSNDDSYDILIGADFFLSHHIYVANSQGKIYLTSAGPAGPPGAPSPPPFQHKPTQSGSIDATLGATRGF